MHLVPIFGKLFQSEVLAMSDEFLNILTGQELTCAFREEERKAQESFDDFFDASNSLAGSFLSEALHSGLGFAYFVSNVKFVELKGKEELERKEIFELVELLQKGASYTRAGLLLLRSGHLSESIATARQLAEGCNLLKLFEECPDQLNEFVLADEDGRAIQFGVGRVREKLDTSGGYNLFNDVKYGVLSRKFTHFSTSSVYLNTFLPNPLRNTPGFMQGITFNLMGVLAGLFLMFLRSSLTLLKYPPEDSLAEKVIRDLREAVDGITRYIYVAE